jgi:hypothetical protein
MFDQTNDAELFREAETLRADGFRLEGNRWEKGDEVYLPVYEAKMFRPYDHRFGSVFEDTSNWINQGQTTATTSVQHQNPEYLALPRWWVEASIVKHSLNQAMRPAFIGFRDVTRATDSRTFLATMLPIVGATNKVPIVMTTKIEQQELCLLANLNSVASDYCTRQKIGSVSLNFFIVEQLPVLPPDTYAKHCPWERSKSLQDWIAERVLKLTCTAVDLLPLAEACGFTGGSFQAEYGGRLHKWDEAERAELMAQLDAAFFHLYGLNRDDVEYVLTTFTGIQIASSHFPGHVTTAQRILQLYDEYAMPG